MLKEQKNKLTEKVTKIIKEIGHMSDIKKEVGQEFKSRNLSTFRAMTVWMSPDYLFTLTDSNEDIQFLFLFSLALSKAMKNNKIDIGLDVQDYFTSLEYNNWKEYREESQESNDYPIIFEDVQQIGEGMWQTIITAQRFAQLHRDNKLIYNFRNQRNPKVTVSGISIDLDKRKVNKIKNRILNRKQFPDHVKFNILKNFEEELYYDEKNAKLIIYKGIINISDGQHRNVANAFVIQEEPDIEFNWPLVITNYTENDTKEYIWQINEQKPFKKEQKQEWNQNKKENLVVSVIADDRISKLNKIMGSQEAEVKNKKSLVTKNIIAEAISENYKLNDTTDIRGLGKWIVEFTDYLFSLYPREFITDPYSIQGESVINHKNMFYGFIALSTYQDSDWKQKTKNKMESINFNIDNPIWKEIGLFTNKPNKSVRNKIYKLFEEEEVR